jgi:1,4-dihydroxy-2-naphthoyl-CoA hydrolase
MGIWFKETELEDLNKSCENTMVSFLDIKMTEITEDSLVGVMPASDKVKQPYGIVHGGANCVLAESLGSLAANLTLDYTKSHAVGLSITTSHIKAVRNGTIKGVAKPVHIGKKTQVWEIKSYNDANQLTSSTTLTMAVINRL